jgi:VanZ family protein
VQAAVWRWAPVVAWAGLIFGLSSISDLGTGLGTWDLVLRKIAHAGEFAVLGFLLLRALRREGVAIALGIAYAISDEVHQHLVPGRVGSPVDVLIDAVGVVAGVYIGRRIRDYHFARGRPEGRRRSAA